MHVCLPVMWQTWAVWLCVFVYVCVCVCVMENFLATLLNISTSYRELWRNALFFSTFKWVWIRKVVLTGVIFYVECSDHWQNWNRSKWPWLAGGSKLWCEGSRPVLVSAPPQMSRENFHEWLKLLNHCLLLRKMRAEPDAFQGKFRHWQLAAIPVEPSLSQRPFSYRSTIKRFYCLALQF